MLPDREIRDFSKLFELIRQGNLAEQAARAMPKPTPMSASDLAAFVAKATQSLGRKDTKG